ncbi:GNAT family N-acetyltransferase [Saxibacter everestensis]|uniref:GNAT family N-acetyltransferase n=1 Tax=Saxibacter everestensis TaxID=2909229 RepID=A0ABY8QTN7_9MICO|nr:GNAT family N-acetyltransferase [Brevibacteriaceae bacterium ZFBP1038]
MPDLLEELWPPYGLKISCGPLTLSPVQDGDFLALDRLVQSGVHDPNRMPFFVPWTDGEAEDVRLRLLQYHWSQRAAMKPESWALETAVRFDGVIVGCQAIKTKDYRVTRTGETGSWLGLEHHGKGIGTLMRQVICAFMFDHMDAAEVTSAAFTDNPASLAVSRKVGYRDNGTDRVERRDDELAINQRLVLTPDSFVRPEYELTVQGLAPFRKLLGLDRTTSAGPNVRG